MLTFTAHRRADPMARDFAKDDQDVVFIKDGFAWLGLLIPVIWMLWHRLWRPLAGYLIVIVLIAVAGFAVPLPGSLTASMGLLANLFVGLEGNNFRRRALARRGFEEVADIAAASNEEASFRFFAARISDQNG